MRHIHFSEIDSTYSYLEREARCLSAPLTVTADMQTAGRGQRGNKWESEPHKNLTAAVLWKPVGLPPQSQFSMSEAVALAVASSLLKMGAEDVKVKWPNDIYVGDKKIAGILIKHSLSAECIAYSIIGIGVNLNQDIFVSDAPNPISLKMATGREICIDEYMKLLEEELTARLSRLADEAFRKTLHSLFLESLWRHDGMPYPFRDVASGEIYPGTLEDVEPTGFLHVIDAKSGVRHRYAFKEVAFVL